MQPGSVKVCASGTSVCGASFERCYDVFVNPSDGGGLGGLQENPVESTTQEDRGASNNATNDLSGMVTAKKVIPSMSMYPSPATKGQNVTLQLPQLSEMAEITVMDLQGRMLLQERTTETQPTLATGQLPAGLYIIRVSAGDWMETTKLVIE